MVYQNEEVEYYAPAAVLPTALPSRNDIATCSEVLSNRTGCRVVGVGRHYVVKYGTQVDLNEGETMLYLSRTTTVRVPRVFALFRDGETQKNFIIMERIHGQSLEQVWPSLSKVDKQDIADQLKNSMDELRLLPSPGVFCALHSRPLPDRLFETDKTLVAGDGVFGSENELNAALLKRYETSEARSLGRSEFYSRMWPSVFSKHPPVFTHGDFQRKNVLLAGEANAREVVLIDWETAGWYPSYWEHARALFICARFEDDWSIWLEAILEPFLKEYAWMYTFMCETWI